MIAALGTVATIVAATLGYAVWWVATRTAASVLISVIRDHPFDPTGKDPTRNGYDELIILPGVGDVTLAVILTVIAAQFVGRAPAAIGASIGSRPAIARRRRARRLRMAARRTQERAGLAAIEGLAELDPVVLRELSAHGIRDHATNPPEVG